MAERLTATDFIEALHRAEDAGDLDPLVALFGAKAEVSNPTLPQPLRGVAGARAFWSSYRRTFWKIHSAFRVVLESDQAIVLEWTTRGSAADGKEIVYEGVSVIEQEDGAIRRFRAYFDPRALGAQLTGEGSGDVKRG